MAIDATFFSRVTRISYVLKSLNQYKFHFVILFYGSVRNVHSCSEKIAFLHSAEILERRRDRLSLKNGIVLTLQYDKMYVCDGWKKSTGNNRGEIAAIFQEFCEQILMLSVLLDEVKVQYRETF